MRRVVKGNYNKNKNKKKIKKMKNILNKLFNCFNKNNPVYSPDNISTYNISSINVNDQNVWHINTVVNSGNRHYRAYLNQYSDSAADISNVLGSYLTDKISAVDTINSLF
jgi:hypothetical protein